MARQRESNRHARSTRFKFLPGRNMTFARTAFYRAKKKASVNLSARRERTPQTDKRHWTQITQDDELARISSVGQLGWTGEKGTVKSGEFLESTDGNEDRERKKEENEVGHAKVYTFLQQQSAKSLFSHTYAHAGATHPRYFANDLFEFQDDPLRIGLVDQQEFLLQFSFDELELRHSYTIYVKTEK